MAALTLELAPTAAPAQELEPAPASAPAPAPARELGPAPASAPTAALESASASVPAPAPSWAQGGDGDGSGNDNDNSSGSVGVLTLLRLKERMKEQLMEYNRVVQASQENFPDHAAEENFLRGATQDLQRDVEEVKVSLQNKTLALQRIQIMDALRNKLKQDDEDSRLILETMKHIVLLSQTIIEYQQQAQQKEQQLIDSKRKRLSLKKDGGWKLQQIQTMMKSQKEKQASVNVTETEKMLNRLEQERQMTTVIQNVFQNLIIGSRVNWAEDPSLKAIVLQLEKNVYLQQQTFDQILELIQLNYLKNNFSSCPVSSAHFPLEGNNNTRKFLRFHVEVDLTGDQQLVELKQDAQPSSVPVKSSTWKIY